MDRIKDGTKNYCTFDVLTMTIDELTEMITAAQQYYLQCCCHAIRDCAVGAVNRFFADAMGVRREEAEANEHPDDRMRNFLPSPRYRLDRCQHVLCISREINRMSRYGIIALMQPYHLLFDGDYVDSLLRVSQKRRSYVGNSFIRSGVHVALGSDWMVGAADIMDGLWASLMRVSEMTAIAPVEKNADGLHAASQICNKDQHHHVKPMV